MARLPSEVAFPLTLTFVPVLYSTYSAPASLPAFVVPFVGRLSCVSVLSRCLITTTAAAAANVINRSGLSDFNFSFFFSLSNNNAYRLEKVWSWCATSNKRKRIKKRTALQRNIQGHIYLFSHGNSYNHHHQHYVSYEQ